MEIKLRKWGNSIGLRIPYQLARKLGIDENSVVELTEAQDSLIIKKIITARTLDELLASIPENFEYPDDTQDFTTSEPSGDEYL